VRAQLAAYLRDSENRADTDQRIAGQMMMRSALAMASRTPERDGRIRRRQSECRARQALRVASRDIPENGAGPRLESIDGGDWIVDSEDADFTPRAARMESATATSHAHSSTHAC